MINRLLKYAIPLSLLLLSACTQDDEPGAESRQMLFAASISEQPRSRVSETADGLGSTWSNGDQIFVQVTQGGTSSSTNCALDASGKVTAYSPTLYWKDGAGSASVLAWYSNITGYNSTATSTINFADQSKGLAYVLRATATANSGEQISLSFTHQLAKVRVKVTGDGAADVNTVKINNYQTCNVTNGYANPGTAGYITTMKNGEYFEANVVPTNNAPDDLISFGDDFAVEVGGIYKLEAGKVYTITIDAKGKVVAGPTIDINGQTGVMMREPSNTQSAIYLADCNIGAEKPEDVGIYFWWGDVIGHDKGANFNFASDNTDITTYGKTIQQLYDKQIITTNNKSTAVLRPEYDAAVQLWKGGWRMPSETEWEWLLKNCDWTWQSSKQGAAGYWITSRCANGGKVFLPTAPYLYGATGVGSAGYGFYWTSSPYDAKYANALYITSAQKTVFSSMESYCGLTIRPVFEIK